MAEHLDLHRPARRAADSFAGDGIADRADLLQPDLPGQYDHVGELAVVAQGLAVGNAQLRGDVYLQAQPPGFRDCGDIRGDDGAYARFAGRLKRPAHRGEVVVVEGDVEGQVAAEPVLPADPADFLQVFRREIVGRVRAHVELPDAEIHGVGATLDGGLQAFEVACRSHDFQTLIFHGG